MIPFLLLISLIVMFPGCLKYAPKSSSISKPNGKQIEVTKKHYNPDETTSIYYPQLNGLKDEWIQEQVNNELKKSFNVDEIASSCSQMYADSDDDFVIVMHKTGDYDFQVFNTLIMIKVYSYLWEEGAPGGYSFVSTLCINGLTGEFYALQDILKSPEGLIALQRLLQPKLEQEREHYALIVDEIPAIKPDQCFYITPEGIEIIFEPYEIARGFNLFPSFVVTWQEVDGILNKESQMYKTMRMS